MISLVAIHSFLAHIEKMQTTRIYPLTGLLMQSLWKAAICGIIIIFIIIIPAPITTVQDFRFALRRQMITTDFSKLSRSR